MKKKTHRYESDGVVVTWDAGRCIHAAECVKNLPTVFDPDERPWIQPGEADVDEVARTVERCPTGALRYERHDGGDQEAAAARNRLQVAASGPVYDSGDFHLEDADGTAIGDEPRVALCRCGASAAKPFCDGSHSDAGFDDDGAVAERDSQEGVEASGQVTVKVAGGGPLLLAGGVEICDAAGEVRYRGAKVALCRCGASATKPFCDGSHTAIDFDG